jgi:hypothetical protein
MGAQRTRRGLCVTVASSFKNHWQLNTEYWQLIMGRTVLPYSQVWEAERSRWQKFRRALRHEDQMHLDRLFEAARLHLQAGVYASNPWPMESLLLSMLLEHQKTLSELIKRLRRLEQQVMKEGLADREAPTPPSNSPPIPL